MLYSPILLSGFNEEKYANQPSEEDEAEDGKAKVEDAKAKKELRAGVAAARAEGDPLDIILKCNMLYCILRGMIF